MLAGRQTDELTGRKAGRQVDKLTGRKLSRQKAGQSCKLISSLDRRQAGWQTGR